MTIKSTIKWRYFFILFSNVHWVSGEMTLRSHNAIDLIEDKKPPFIPLYNLFQKKLTKLRRYIENALVKEWIKHSVSFVDASMLFVFKKDDELRLCVNYRELNAITIKNRHSLFLITKTLNRLCEFKYFIKLNFKNVYYRIKIKTDDEWKTTFRIRYDHFEYQIMLFELINASAIFQVYINKILRDFIDVICVVYLNDILIYNSDSTHHWRNVKKVLKRLRNYQLYVNLKKDRFAITKVEFLNFIVFTKKIRMNEKRVRIIKKWLKSTIYRKLQMFLNFVNFYKKFIHRYSKIAELLISLLKGNKAEKNRIFLNDLSRRSWRFVIFVIFLSLFRFFVITIQKRKCEWKLIFSILLLLIFSVNKITMKIDVR